MGLWSSVQRAIISFTKDMMNTPRAREKKLQELRKFWDAQPKGTPVVFTRLALLTQVPAGGTPAPLGALFLGNHMINAGQGAMLMGMWWPIVVPDKNLEWCVTFIFWCNYGHYAYLLPLSDYDGTLPFHVLS